MSGAAELRDAHLRITVLRLLAESPADALNDSMLYDLVSEFAFGVSRDKLRCELDWLGEQGLVAVEELRGLARATLTAKGADVAAGRVAHRGVKKPTRLG